MTASLAPAPSDPVPTPPARRPGSIRRTSTMLMSWPGGLGTELHLNGRARDLLTPVAGEPEVLAATTLDAVTGQTRDIQQIDAFPAVDGLERLLGCRAGGNLRKTIAQELPHELEAGTPFTLLLDDLAGATLIAGFAFFVWADEIPGFHERMTASPPVMVGICSGFQQGSSALHPDGTLKGVSTNTPRPGPLADPSDPMGWHELPDHPAIAMRRARRIDVWEEGGEVRIDAMFRDSCWNPQGEEAVVHEYEIFGTADPEAGTLTAVRAVPRVLPYPECPGAAANAPLMEGTPLHSLRREVLERLRNTDCCTHLNDALRALAEVPVLAALLPSAREA
ncbi:MAG: DUF2889 domain-containing protein [Acidimicrobiales bacterium]